MRVSYLWTLVEGRINNNADYAVKCDWQTTTQHPAELGTFESQA